MVKAFASMVVQMAVDTKVTSASNTLVSKKKLPIASDLGPIGAAPHAIRTTSLLCTWPSPIVSSASATSDSG
jgi:hypothetical protein